MYARIRVSLSSKFGADTLCIAGTYLHASCAWAVLYRLQGFVGYDRRGLLKSHRPVFEVVGSKFCTHGVQAHSYTRRSMRAQSRRIQLASRPTPVRGILYVFPRCVWSIALSCARHASFIPLIVTVTANCSCDSVLAHTSI